MVIEISLSPLGSKSGLRVEGQQGKEGGAVILVPCGERPEANASR